MSAMPERGQVLVTNTTPLIALTAATGSLDILKFLYPRVVVPLEVADEVRAGGRSVLVWMFLTAQIGWTSNPAPWHCKLFCVIHWMWAKPL